MDFRDEGRTRKPLGSGCHVQVHLLHFSDGPTARDRYAHAARISGCLMDDMESGTKQVGHLVILIVLDRLLERHKIGLQCAETIEKDRTAVRPFTVPLPQVER